jgi:hypothetical protein
VFAGFLAVEVVIQDGETFREQRDVQENEDSSRRAIGEWLCTHTRPDAIVAMEAVGYEGTYSRRRVVDLAGVISPAVVEMRRETGTAAGTFERLIEHYHPDAVVLRTREVSGEIRMHGGPIFETPSQRQRFMDEYVEAVRFVAPHAALWGPLASLTVYVRKGPAG